jgi:glycosidase
LFYTANHDENSWNGTEYEKYGLAAASYAVFCATWSSGIPLIYSGQESPNKKRLAFFQKDAIEWQAHPKLQSFYQTLLNLHQTKAITKGETFILPTHNNYIMAYLRKYENESILVLINFHGESKIKLTVEHQWLNGTFTNVFSGFSYDFKSGETFELMGYDYMIYQKVEAPQL